MILFLILAISWAAILIAGIALYRMATYADQRVRKIAARRSFFSTNFENNS